MRLVPAALAALLFVQAPTAAVNPLDDDAGSGGDAGDVPELAVPIGEGTFAGRLGTPHDLEDHYVFGGRAGQVVRLSFQAAGNAFATVGTGGSAASGETVDVVLTKDGPTLLAVTTPFLLLATSVGHIPYTFTLRFVEAPGVAWARTEGPAFVAEARWAAPRPSVLAAEVELPFQPEAPLTVMFVVEWSSVEDPYAWSVAVISAVPHGAPPASGLGRHVAVSPGLEDGIELPVIRTNETAVIAGVGLSSDGLHWVRAAIHASVPSGIAFSFLSQAPFEHRFATEVEGFFWDERNAGAEVQVLAPGLSVTGPRSVARDLDGRSVVFMDTAGWDGTITDPAGRTRHLDLLHPVEFVIFPDLGGTWTFGLGPTAGAGFGAVHRYLHHVRVPSLGLAP